MKADVIAEHSILFLGSGFSTESTNRLGKQPPTGNGLKRELARRARVSPEPYSLTDLAEYCANEDRKGLHDFIQDTFRITKVSGNQKDILAAPWLRLYTTNFDDSAEVGRRLAGLSDDNYSFADEKPRRINDGTVIHLHGMVRNVTTDNVLEQIVLGESAYVRQHLERSTWYDQFLYDLKFASKCYFLGYSLSDQHIAALLLQNPRSRDKVLFIEPDRIPDRIFASKIEKYGEIVPIGLDGFADLCRNRIPAPAIADFHALRAFKLLEAQPDRRAHLRPTINEVRDFLIHGRLNMARLMSSLPKPVYAMPREQQAEKGYQTLQKNRSLVVDARLGNGKSVFEYLLFAKLAERGHRCVMVKNVDDVPAGEVEFLRRQSDLVIFFETYTTAQILLEPLSQALPNAKFVVEVRTSLFEVRLFEIEAKVPRPYGRLSLNKLDMGDRADFLEVCRNAGVVLRGIDVNAHWVELRDLLIAVFDSQAIRQKIRDDLERCLSDADTRRIVTIVFLMQIVQADVDADFLRLVSGVDPFSVLSENIEGSEEIFSLLDGDVTLRSSVFAEFAMQQFVPTADLSQAVHDCAVFCANRKSHSRYRTLLTMFTQYSRIRPMYAKRNDAVDQLRALYERLRWYPNVQDEPLFWLQFAILELDEGHRDDAKRYLDFSYAEAHKRRGFLTYQIDTQYLRYVCESIIEEPAVARSDMFDDLVRYTSVVGAMLGEDSHRFYALKVLENVPDVVSKIASALSDGEKLALRTCLAGVADIIASSSPEFLAQSGASQFERRLRTNIAML